MGVRVDRKMRSTIVSVTRQSPPNLRNPGSDTNDNVRTGKTSKDPNKNYVDYL